APVSRAVPPRSEARPASSSPRSDSRPSMGAPRSDGYRSGPPGGRSGFNQSRGPQGRGGVQPGFRPSQGLSATEADARARALREAASRQVEDQARARADEARRIEEDARRRALREEAER